MARTVPNPSVNVFFAGVPSDLATIEAMLITLPLCAYGQVLIESDDELPEVALPRRVQMRRVPVTVNWLSGEALPGESIARAADAWRDEWMIDESADSASRFYAWIGCDRSDSARDAAHRIEHSLRIGLAGN